MKQPVTTNEAPPALGPYSQAVRTGDLLFLSGQIPIDPGKGELVLGSVEEQTRRVMDNLGAVLRGGGASFDDVVKTTIFLADLADFGAVNSVYGSYFTGVLPARSTVQVAALPLGVKLEIDMIARVP